MSVNHNSLPQQQQQQQQGEERGFPTDQASADGTHNHRRLLLHEAPDDPTRQEETHQQIQPGEQPGQYHGLTASEEQQVHPQPDEQREAQRQQTDEPTQAQHLQEQQQHEPSQHPENQTQPHLQDACEQQQAPTVLVVQQPIILGRGAYIRRGQPFMYRGVQLGNGRKIGMNCMITLGVFGMMLIMWGIVHGINTLLGFVCVFVGGVQIGSCFRLCHKAKHDFDSLPQDHPDRVTYSSPIILSREAREIASSTTTYQLPSGAQIISSSPLQGGHMGPTYQLPAGAQVISSTSTVDGRLAPPAFLQQALAAASSSARASANDDKPPSYEEVCKQMRP